MYMQDCEYEEVGVRGKMGWPGAGVAQVGWPAIQNTHIDREKPDRWKVCRVAARKDGVDDMYEYMGCTLCMNTWGVHYVYIHGVNVMYT